MEIQNSYEFTKELAKFLNKVIAQISPTLTWQMKPDQRAFQCAIRKVFFVVTGMNCDSLLRKETVTLCVLSFERALVAESRDVRSDNLREIVS